MIDKFDRYMLTVIAVILVLLGAVAFRGDQIGVEVEEHTPSDGSVVSTSTEIRITFDQAVERESVIERFTIVPAVPGEFRWRGGNIMLFRPDVPLEAGQRYDIRLDAGVRSVTGRTMDERLSWSFVTQTVSVNVYYMSPARASRQGLWAIEPDGSNPRDIFSPESGVFSFAPHPNGSELAVTVLSADAGSADIWIVDANGESIRQLTDCFPGVCGQPAWSPNGDLLAYAKQEPNEFGSLSPARIWLWDLETNQTAPVFEDNQVLGFYPIWSPDGNLLSFYDSNTTAIRIVDYSTGDLRLVETQLPERWSFDPSSTILAYSDLRSDDGWFYPQLLTVEVQGEASRDTIITNAEQDQEPLYSPDGEWIVFRRRLVDGGSNGSQLMLYNVADDETMALTTDPDYTNSNAQWSPDSSQIIFQRYLLRTAEFVPEIWIYDLETSELRLLVTNAANGNWLGCS